MYLSIGMCLMLLSIVMFFILGCMALVVWIAHALCPDAVENVDEVCASAINVFTHE